jgi:hypothetical protein
MIRRFWPALAVVVGLALPITSGPAFAGVRSGTLHGAVTATTPATRPATGVLVRSARYFGGLGQLTVDNTAGGQDGVAILLAANNKTTVAWVYVRHGAQYTLTSIVDGHYHLYFTTGTGWEAARWRFRSTTSYERVTDPDPMSFSTTSSTYTTWTMTLYSSSSCTNGCMQSEGHAPLPPPSH